MPDLAPGVVSRDGGKAREREAATSLEHYIAYLLIMLRHARLWPVVSFSPCGTLISAGTTATFIVGLFLLLLSEITVLTMSHSLKLFANVIGVIGLHAVALIKWCYCISRNREIYNIVMKLRRCHVLCQRVDSSEEGRRMYETEMEHARRNSKIFICWWLLACNYGVIHWCLNPFFLDSWGDEINLIASNHTLLSERKLPFIAWYPWDIDDTSNYIFLYLLQTLGAISSALGCAYYDNFYVALLIVISAQFRHINAMLMRTNEYDRQPEVALILAKRLKNCVKWHVEIIKLLKALENFSSPMMFVQCVETLIVICLVSFEATALEFTLDKECILKLWSLFEYFACLCIQLYVFCLFATQLEHLGTQIAHSVYSCGWEFSRRAPKGEQLNFREQLKCDDVTLLVQTIMTQAQRPIILTGGPFYVLSLETFRVILSMAISNSVMLHTISDRDE